MPVLGRNVSQTLRADLELSPPDRRVVVSSEGSSAEPFVYGRFRPGTATMRGLKMRYPHWIRLNLGARSFGKFPNGS